MNYLDGVNKEITLESKNIHDVEDIMDAILKVEDFNWNCGDVYREEEKQEMILYPMLDLENIPKMVLLYKRHENSFSFKPNTSIIADFLLEHCDNLVLKQKIKVNPKQAIEEIAQLAYEDFLEKNKENQVFTSFQEAILHLAQSEDLEYNLKFSKAFAACLESCGLG